MRKLDFSDVLMMPQPSRVNSRRDVDLNVSYGAYSGVPVIVANMDAVGTFKMADSLWRFGINVALHKYVPIDTIKKLINYISYEYVWVSIGIQPEDLIRLKEINPRRVIIDCPNAYITKAIDFVKSVRDAFPNMFIIAGNVCTPEGCELLIEAGANGVKAGIGGGALCHTRSVTGIGYPQFSLIQECAPVCEQYNSLLISDGGVREVGDICKSIGAGAHVVMCGSLFMGCEENENIVFDPLTRTRSVLSYGMSSRAANDKYNGGLKDYRASEGDERLIPVARSVSEVAQQIRGGLASSCTYQNFRSISEMRGNSVFVEC